MSLDSPDLLQNCIAQLEGSIHIQPLLVLPSAGLQVTARQSMTGKIASAIRVQERLWRMECAWTLVPVDVWTARRAIITP